MKSKKKVLFNSVIIYVRMIFIMVITLYISRLTLDTLGVDVFGLYSVIAGFVLLGGVLTNSLSGAFQRFISESLAVGDVKNKRETVRYCLTVAFFWGTIATLLVVFLGSVFVGNYLNQTVALIDDVYTTLFVSAISFLIITVASPLLAIIHAHERMQSYAFFTVLDVLFKVVFILYFELNSSALVNFSYAIFLATLTSKILLFLYVAISFREYLLLPGIRYSQKKEMLSFILWNMIGGMAFILNAQGINVMLNIFFGVAVNAARAIASQVNSALMQLLSSINVAVSPQMVSAHVKNQGEKTFALLILSCKVSVFLCTFMFTSLYFNVEYLLDLWLGVVPVVSVIFVKLALLEFFFNSLSAPILSAILANGNIKKYQKIVGGILLLNIPISFVFLWMGFDESSVYFVSILIACITLILRMKFAEILLGISINKLLTKVVAPAMAYFLSAQLVLNILHFNVTNLLGLFMFILLTALIVIILFPIFLLDSDEKKHIKSYLRLKVSKYEKY